MNIKNWVIYNKILKKYVKNVKIIPTELIIETDDSKDVIINCLVTVEYTDKSIKAKNFTDKESAMAYVKLDPVSKYNYKYLTK